MNLTQFANEILELQEENKRLRATVIRLKEFEDNYYQLQKSSMAHSEAMLWNLVQAHLNKTKEPS